MTSTICHRCGVRPFEGCDGKAIITVESDEGPRPFACPRMVQRLNQKEFEREWPVPDRFREARLGEVPVGLPCTREQRMRLEKAHEAFLTSSLRGVRALVTFQGRVIGGGVPGPATRILADAVASRRGFDGSGIDAVPARKEAKHS